MKQFFKFTLASIVGFLISGILLIVIFFSVIFSMISSAESKFSSDKKVQVKDKTVLHLTFSQEIVDQASENPFEQIALGNFNPEKKLSLKKALDAIKNAKDDERIKGIFMDLSENQTNAANMEEIRNALVDFKTSGKFIIAYAEMYSQKSYFLATLADEIHLYPTGDVDLRGLYSELMFFKGTLDKLEVEAQIIRGTNNKFKSAVEPFMYDKMSEANREQITKLISGIWSNYSGSFADGRNLTTEQINQIADKLLASSAQEALNLKLVDKLSYRDEVIKLLMDKVSVEKEKDLNFIELAKYAKVPAIKKDSEDEENEEKTVDKPWDKKDKIAVVYAVGEIRSGRSETGIMGSETIAKAIKEAREDSTVKAVVLRVNSPGGSALASDVIWRETILTKQVKPLVVSMGGLAASGGYYISCGADKIYADKNTITGSIGVFGMIPNAQKMFKNKLGITFDGAKTNENADLMSISKPLTPYQFEVIQKSVDLIYSDFMQKVSDGRSLTVEFVDSVGQGRVWTGADALSLGLVDEIGGINEALEYAKNTVGIEDFKLVNYPKEKNPFEKFLEEFSAEAKLWFLGEELKSELELYNKVKTLTQSDKIQARIPFVLEIY